LQIAVQNGSGRFGITDAAFEATSNPGEF
jgi:hypothetical protein